jgi:hypothetical protein
MSTSDPADGSAWRVSVATLDRVVIQSAFDRPQMLILERAATLLRDKGADSTVVQVKPFGGAVRILDAPALRQHIGDFEFDSPHSQAEQDFRILLPAAAWEKVKQFCLLHLVRPDDAILETGPQRELAEEFMDALHIELEEGQVLIRPAGLVVENKPAPTANLYSPGMPTARIYRIFEATIYDSSLGAALLENSRRYSDHDLKALAAGDAAHAGKGRANAALALPLEGVTRAYLETPLPQRTGPLTVDDHLFDPSVIAVLENVDAPQYEKLCEI